MSLKLQTSMGPPLLCSRAAGVLLGLVVERSARRAKRGRRQEAAVVRRVRCLVVDPGDDAVARRGVARLRPDLAGARWPARGPESPHGSGVAAPARHEPRVHARRQGRDVHDRADEGGGREGTAVGSRTRRRERSGQRKRRAGPGPGRRQHAAAHVRRDHDARHGTGRDGRARRRRQPSGGVVLVGGDAPRTSGRGGAADAVARLAGAAAGAARAPEPPAAAVRQARRQARDSPKARRAPSARTTAAI